MLVVIQHSFKHCRVDLKYLNVALNIGFACANRTFERERDAQKMMIKYMNIIRNRLVFLSSQYSMLSQTSSILAHD